jgi:hypothetical protein
VLFMGVSIGSGERGMNGVSLKSTLRGVSQDVQ